MKIINKIKILIMIMLSIVVMGNINIYTVFAEEKIASGIYEVSNEVYHDTEIGMSMARSYLKDTMTLVNEYTIEADSLPETGAATSSALALSMGLMAIGSGALLRKKVK